MEEEEDNFSDQAFELDVPVTLAEEQLQQNPSDLELLIKLLFYYKAKKDYGNLERIRENLLFYYSMDEMLWLEWIEEKQQENFSNIIEVVQLYEKALQDLKYFEISKSYCKYIEGAFYCSVVSFEDFEKVVEKLIDRFFYDLDRSSYFLRRKLKTVLKLSASKKAESSEDSQKQIRECFQRILKAPSADISLNFQKYEEWEKDPVQKNKLELIYNETFRTVSEIIDWEEKFQVLLNEKNLELILLFMEQLPSNMSEAMNRSRVIHYFEVLVENFATNSEIWLQYYKFVKSSKGSPVETNEVLRRASRNCFTNEKIALLFLESSEAIRVSPLLLSASLNRMKSIISSLPPSQMASEFLSSIFLWEAGSLSRRLTSPEPNHQKETCPKEENDGIEEEMKRGKHSLVNQIRVCFQSAINNAPSSKNKKSSLAISALRSWSIFETYSIRDSEKAIEVFEQLVRADGAKLEHWQSYVLGLMHLNQREKASQVFKRGLEYCLENPVEGMGRMWAEFESIFGDSESIEAARTRIEKKKETSKKLKRTLGGQNNDPGKARERLLGNRETTNERKEIKFVGPEENEPGVPKAKKSHEVTVYVSNLPEVMTNSQIERLFTNFHKIIEIRRGNNKKVAYVDFLDTPSATEAIQELNGSTLPSGEILEVAYSDSPKKKDKKSKKAVFINNLPFKASKDQIRLFFKKYDSEIEDIRLIMENGVPRGFGFIEMASEEAKQRLLSETGGSIKILGRVVQIKDAIGNSQKKERNDELTIALNGLPGKTTESEIVALIREAVPSIDETPRVIIQKQRDHFCFLVFKNPENAKRLLRKHGQLKFKGSNLQVSLSKKDFRCRSETQAIGQKRLGTIGISSLSVNQEKKKETSEMETEKPIEVPRDSGKRELGNVDFKKFL